jgi:NADH:ubiquinone oxidoreductase subunit 6 (subunit J)
MSQSQVYLAAAAIFLATLGMWLMLPRGRKGGRLLGAAFSAASLACFGALGQCLGHWSDNLVFGVMGTTAVVSSALAVTFRSPIYCAIWFALSLLATAGLFMVQGAQFLGVATVVVYAGAILVTFLFVIMLAQPEGHAFYDRVSWEGLLASVTGAVLVGILTMTTVAVLAPSKDPRVMAALAADQPAGVILPVDKVRGARVTKTSDGKQVVELQTADAKPLLADESKLKELNTALAASLAKPLDTSADQILIVLDENKLPAIRNPGDRAKNILNKEHVAKLGGEMFSRHLIAVEIAGTLLLVALVGAIAILSIDRSAKPRPLDAVATKLGGRGPRPTPANTLETSEPELVGATRHE